MKKFQFESQFRLWEIYISSSANLIIVFCLFKIYRGSRSLFMFTFWKPNETRWTKYYEFNFQLFWIDYQCTVIKIERYWKWLKSKFYTT